MSYNLPPGVSASDIPGNRPQDVEAERIAEELSQALLHAALAGWTWDQVLDLARDEWMWDQVLDPARDEWDDAQSEAGIETAAQHGGSSASGNDRSRETK